MSYNDSHRNRKKTLHLKYKKETGRYAPQHIEGDEAERYVDWLEEELERQCKKEEEIINMRTLDETD